MSLKTIFLVVDATNGSHVVQDARIRHNPYHELVVEALCKHGRLLEKTSVQVAKWQ